MSKPRLLIVATVPITLRMILRSQPRFLSSYFDVTLATSAPDGCPDIAAVEFVPVAHVPMERRIAPLRDLSSILRMVRLIRRFRPQIIHSYTPKAGLVAMAAGWLCRVPVRIHTFTGLLFPSQSGLRQKLLRAADSLICGLATRVVPEGRGVQRDLIEFAVTAKPLEVIGYGNIAGVDTDHFSPRAPGVGDAAARLRHELALSDDDFVFCFVGRLNPDKGIVELLAAFDRLPDNARLLLVGGEEESAPLDAATAAALRAHPRVHALGFLDDIRPPLMASQSLVLPSYREGFPNVVLQAGAMELPVIATDVNGSNEVIEPGRNGWLVPVRDAQRLEKAMQAAMVASTAERAAMGRHARRLIEQRFERGAHWRRMLDFYRNELGEKGL